MTAGGRAARALGLRADAVDGEPGTASAAGAGGRCRAAGAAIAAMLLLAVAGTVRTDVPAWAAAAPAEAQHGRRSPERVAPRTRRGNLGPRGAHPTPPTDGGRRAIDEPDADGGQAG